MKICKKCLINRNIIDFGKNKYVCKICRRKENNDYFKTKKGLITKIYSHQSSSSRSRWGILPDYTNLELFQWVLLQPNFEELYNKWVKHGYITNLRPSIDRINDYKGYSLANIQLMTWEENRSKGHCDMKSGINNKQNKAVIGINKKTGEKVEFYSVSEAGRQIGIQGTHISKCCKLDINKYSAGGYYWRYKYTD